MKKTIKKRIKDAHLADRIKQGMKKRFFSFLFFVTFLFLLILIFLPQVEDSVQDLIISYGLIGVFLIAFFADMLMQPIGPDVPLFIGIGFGLNPLQVLGLVLLASYLATFLGYYLGLKFGKDGFRKIYGEKKYLILKHRYNKYSLIVPFAALTPVPYVPICWISGIFKMNKIKFFLYALVPRTIRLSLVALFALGVL